MLRIITVNVKLQVVCPLWPTWGLFVCHGPEPFTASTLQIGGYHSYQHCKQFKSQSQSRTALFFKDSNHNYRAGELLAACGVGSCDSLLSAKWKREWHPSSRPKSTYNLLFVCHGHAQEHSLVEGVV